MSSKLPWPNSNAPHYRPSSPQLTSPVILLVDDTNMQPTKRPYREQFSEQAEPEQRDGVDIVLMTRRASSRYFDDGNINTGKAAGGPSAPPVERESLYEDDIPDSGENTSCDEAQPGKFYEAKKASIQPGHSRTNASFYQPPPRRGSNARKNLIKASAFPESVYSIAPQPGTHPASPGPSRESAYSVAGASGPGGKLPAHYSLANWEQLASPPATATTFFSEKGINSASCWPAPLQPTRNSGSTTTRDSDLISDAELSQRTSTSTTTTCSSSLRSSGRRSNNKWARPPSAASGRDSLPAHEERYSPRSKISSRTSDGRQMDGWPSSSARTSGGGIPFSERKPEPRRVNIRDSLPISERSSLQGPSAPPGSRRAPAARTQFKDQSMVTSKPVYKMDVTNWCRKCYGPRVTHLKDMDQSRPEEIAKRLETVQSFRRLGFGRKTRCFGHQKRCAGDWEKCVEHRRCFGPQEGCNDLQQICGAYQKRVYMSQGEEKLAELRVAEGSNVLSNRLPNSLAGSIPRRSVAKLISWEWI